MTKTSIDLSKIPCSECGGTVRRKLITQEYEREGLRVEVSGIRAFVCTDCEAIYFTPGGAQALVESVNSLFALARRSQQRKGKIRVAARPKTSHPKVRKIPTRPKVLAAKKPPKQVKTKYRVTEPKTTELSTR